MSSCAEKRRVLYNYVKKGSGCKPEPAEGVRAEHPPLTLILSPKWRGCLNGATRTLSPRGGAKDMMLGAKSITLAHKRTRGQGAGDIEARQYGLSLAKPCAKRRGSPSI